MARERNDCQKHSAVTLGREINLLQATSYVIGSIIGSGIFISPSGVLMQAGSLGWSLVVWSLCGVFSLLGAFTYAELGTSIPRSGGDYAYCRYAFGDLPAFVFSLWNKMLLVGPGGIAIMALTFAEYAIEPFYRGCGPPPNITKQLLSVLIICRYPAKILFKGLFNMLPCK